MSEPVPTPALLPRLVARTVLAAIAVVALVEWLASAFVYRDAIAPEDWHAAATALGALPDDEPVRLGTTWLGPRARMHLPRLARWDAVAPPDLRGATRLHVLGRTGDRWSDHLRADLEDLPPPTLASTTPLGGLALYTYALPTAGTVLADFVADADRLEVETDAGRCRGARHWSCEEGRIATAVAEVEYRARRCLRLELEDGATAHLRYRSMPSGDVLRGHLGVHDFNARLRSDAPLRVRVEIDGRRVAQWLVTDAQGWWPFAVRTEPGTHDVTVSVTSPVRGTWQRGGYDRGRSHAACIELRSLQEGSS